MAPGFACCAELPLQPLLAHRIAPDELRGPTWAAGPISGRVVDEKGGGLPGVNVIVKGPSLGTQTNADGRYTLEVPDGATLVFSYVGYASQEVVVGSRTTVDAALVVDSNALADVVMGYLAQDRQNVSSAVSSLDVKEATKTPVATVVQGIQGRVAGVQAQGSGGPGDTPVIAIRGSGSTGLSNKSPLYVIDGLWTDNIRALNPNDIATLNILKMPRRRLSTAPVGRTAWCR
ncbi:carboxypeptidase-like regulatory domain-containing protein [Hymenobacter sp. PAMC 26628]|uniref:carboxypeptidase-like regulatory domain-containing protein n=1 Tax=Hymenobacter sp. PAMC 26628 TaxID=1484118 RepID=UPI00077038EB|nr:carboxypeptidase-like regulatory domain-containing protein [Hymenobacter sp. PAMC 26628]AMJ65778.1 hypothetical protein AXW84_10315 [Hymenobacter sp. PAMC 26628]